MRALLVLLTALAAGAAAQPVAEPNDHREAAGRMVEGELRVDLEAVEAAWHPRGPDGPRLVSPVFAEVGRAPSVPGPLVRTSAGTPVRVRVHNRLDRPIVVRGLLDRAAMDASIRPEDAVPEDPTFFFSDGLVVPPGEARETRFTPSAEVTSVYYGRRLSADGQPIGGDPFVAGGFGDEGSFLGAFVVDPPGAAPPEERLMVITRWAGREDPSTLTTTFKMMINGTSWPHTERLRYAVGDTVRWRVLNSSAIAHPMHLHGFYYAVDARGDLDADTVYAEADRRQVVTDVMPDFSSLRLTWVPERPGNWLFHCHLIRHMGALQRFPAEGEPRTPPAGVQMDMAEMDGMAGLVMGLEVEGPVPDDAPPERTLHLWTSRTPGVFGEHPALSFVATDGEAPPADTLRVPGSPLVLRQGEPTEIVVHNRLDAPLSVHWHGLEVRSLYDGVGHWSGMPGRTRPPIAPGDSAAVLLTPPRAGTFIYHTHGELGHELTQGLYGAFLVLPPGTAWDRERDRVFVLAARGAERDAPPAINGEPSPAPERFAPGESARLRFIHISPDAYKEVRLLRDGEPVRWTPLAKDGADLPAAARVPESAEVGIGVGETVDVAWTPEAEGAYVLEVTTHHYSASGRAPVEQRLAFGVGDVSAEALAEAARVERPAPPLRDTTAAVDLPVDALGPFVGVYGAEGVPVTFTVRLEGDRLLLAVEGMKPGPLVPLGPDLFRWEEPAAVEAGRPYPRVRFAEADGALALTGLGPPLHRVDD